MNKINLLLIGLFVLTTSCGKDNWEAVKRGITGQKVKSTDEFLVEKKNPLILPPDFDELPQPTANQKVTVQTETFEETLKKAKKNKTLTTEKISSTPSSAERSILEKIRKK